MIGHGDELVVVVARDLEVGLNEVLDLDGGIAQGGVVHELVEVAGEAGCGKGHGLIVSGGKDVVVLSARQLIGQHLAPDRFEIGDFQADLDACQLLELLGHFGVGEAGGVAVADAPHLGAGVGLGGFLQRPRATPPSTPAPRRRPLPGHRQEPAPSRVDVSACSSSKSPHFASRPFPRCHPAARPDRNAGSANLRIMLPRLRPLGTAGAARPHHTYTSSRLNGTSPGGGASSSRAKRWPLQTAAAISPGPRASPIRLTDWMPAPARRSGESLSA